MPTLTERINTALTHTILPSICQELCYRLQTDNEFKGNFAREIFKEVVLAGIINEAEYTAALLYLSDQQERLAKEAFEFSVASIQNKVDFLWQQVVPGFRTPYIQRCLIAPDGEEKFAGSVFEAIFDQLFFDETYTEQDLLQIKKYIAENKRKWLTDARTYHKL